MLNPEKELNISYLLWSIIGKNNNCLNISSRELLCRIYLDRGYKEDVEIYFKFYVENNFLCKLEVNNDSVLTTILTEDPQFVISLVKTISELQILLNKNSL